MTRRRKRWGTGGAVSSIAGKRGNKQRHRFKWHRQGDSPAADGGGGRARARARRQRWRRVDQEWNALLPHDRDCKRPDLHATWVALKKRALLLAPGRLIANRRSAAFSTKITDELRKRRVTD